MSSEHYIFPNYQNSLVKSSSFEDIFRYVPLLDSKDESLLLEAITNIRILPDLTLLDQYMEEKIISKLIETLKRAKNSELKAECVQAISNLLQANSQRTIQSITKYNGVDVLLSMLNSNIQSLILPCLKTISVLLSEHSEGVPIYGSLLIQKGILDILNSLSSKFSQEDFQIHEILASITFDLFLIQPLPEWDVLESGVLVLQKIIKENERGYALSKALYFLSQVASTYVQEVIDLGCVPSLIHHLYNSDSTIVFTALRTLGNIITGDDFQVEEILCNPKFLPRVFALLKQSSLEIQKEACWVISNIAAGSQEQIEYLLQDKDYFLTLKDLLLQDNAKIVEEVSYAFCNLGSEASTEQLVKMIEEYDFLECLLIVISSGNSAFKELVYEAFLQIVELSTKKLTVQKKIKEFFEKDVIGFVEEDLDIDEFEDLQEKVEEYIKIRA